MSGKLAIGKPCLLRRTSIWISMYLILLPWQQLNRRIEKPIEQWFVIYIVKSRKLNLLYCDHSLIFFSGEEVPVPDSTANIDIDNMSTEI
jgi:hypothetical protein